MPLPLQRIIAAVALGLAGPLMGAIAMVIRVSSTGPTLHRATRISRGRPFVLLKFRSMRVDAPEYGPAVTASDDERVTAVGRYLRRTKLDELPQLWNVVRGEMALIGPRPEDPRYVDLRDERHRIVFLATPGISGPASIAFRDEEQVLAEAALAVAKRAGRAAPTGEDIDLAYRTDILPRKLEIDATYLRNRSAGGDLRLILQTLSAVLGRSR